MEEEIKEFLDYIVIEKKLSKNTYESYKEDLKHYINFFNKNSIKNITKEDITNFIKHLNKLELSPKSINHIIGTVKGLHTYHSMYYDTPNVMEDV